MAKHRKRERKKGTASLAFQSHLQVSSQVGADFEVDYIMTRLVDGPRHDPLDGGVQGRVALLGGGRDALDAAAATGGRRGRRAQGGVGARGRLGHRLARRPRPGGRGGRRGGHVAAAAAARGGGGRPAGRRGALGGAEARGADAAGQRAEAAKAAKPVGEADRAHAHDDGTHLLGDGGRVHPAHQQRPAERIWKRTSGVFQCYRARRHQLHYPVHQRGPRQSLGTRGMAGRTLVERVARVAKQTILQGGRRVPAQSARDCVHYPRGAGRCLRRRHCQESTAQIRIGSISQTKKIIHFRGSASRFLVGRFSTGNEGLGGHLRCGWGGGGALCAAGCWGSGGPDGPDALA